MSVIAESHSIVTRSAFSGAKVDRENRRITGFVVTSVGPALGHGEMIDEESLRQCVALGNGSPGNGGPIRARMDHPPRGDMTVENPLSKLLGRPMNFRIDGNRVLADLQLLSIAAAPESDRLLMLADEAPDLFGASLVFDHADPGPHMAAVKKGKNPPVRFGTILAVDFVDLPATNPSGLFSAKPHTREIVMGKCAAYVRNGKLYGRTDGDEFEIEVPNEYSKMGAEGGDDDDEEKKGKHSRVGGDVDPEKIRADAIKVEREYSTAFHTAIKTSGMDAKAAEDFHTNFYGRKIEDVKFLASHAIGMRAKAVGEGGGGDGTETDEQKAEKAEKAFLAECEKSFKADTDAGQPRFQMYGVKKFEPESAEYKTGLQRFINRERQWRKDNPATKA